MKPAAAPISAGRPGQLVYLGGTVPAEGTSTPVILFRHLQKAAEAGWRVRIVGPASTAADQFPGFEFVPLPARRPWWPPTSRRMDSLLARLRVVLAASVLRKELGAEPAALLCVLPDYPELPRLLAERLARGAGLPLTVIMHDEPESWVRTEDERLAVDRRCRRLLAAASRVWFVSAELRARYSDDPPAHWEVLPPVSDDRPPPAPSAPAGERLRLVHAGKIFPAYLPGFRSIAKACARAGHRFEIVADDEPGLSALAAESEGALGLRPRFKHNHDLLAHLAAEAHALLVFYPRDGTPWARTSFPSRLVEYVRLGLPVLIVAPAGSSVHTWAKARDWCLLAEPDDEAAIDRLLASLRDPRVLARAREQAAASGFAPAEIHRRFLAGLLPSRPLAP